METILRLEKETKATFVYAGLPIKGVPSPIRSLYVEKWMFADEEGEINGAPERLTVTFDVQQAS